MVGQKKKRKEKAGGKVERALVPTPVFAAVPLSGTAPAAMAPSSSTVAGDSMAVGFPRLHNNTSPTADEFSEPESSLFDYQQMVDAGYQSVGFGTWPARGRNFQREAERPRSEFRSSGLYAEPGDIEGIKETNDPVIKMISDIYATPVKKGKGKSTATGSMENLEGSMTITQRNVRAEMKKIHDLPAEVNETMSRSMRQTASLSYNNQGSSAVLDSGRGSTRPDSLVEDRSPIDSPNFIHISKQLVTNHQRGQLSHTNEIVFEEELDQKSSKTDLKTRLEISSPSSNILERIIEASQYPEQHRKQSLSGHSSRSLKSSRDFADVMEAEQLKLQNAEINAELKTLRKIAEAMEDGDMESARTVYLQKQMGEMKEENENLRSSVHRLNVELSDYQAKHRPVSETQLKQVIEVHGLPSYGPVPSWLISKKYLAPLFLAYDDHLAMKDELIEQIKRECASIKKRVEEVVAENQMLRRSGGPGLGQGDSTEWHQLQEQAKLVLEENQVLMEQLEVQSLKSKDMYKAQEAEISRMARKLALAEGEKADVEHELEQMRIHFQQIKHKHDQLLMESDSSPMKVHSHVNSMYDIKKSVAEEKEQLGREIESLRVKLKASEEEWKRQARQVVDLVAENKGLQVEAKSMHKCVLQTQEKMAMLHKAIELSEDKELITQEQLANVIKVAEKTALERDTVYKVAREQQEETKQTLNKMVQGSAAVGKLELKLKLYQMKASAKLNRAAERLREQDEAFNSQKKEYEREIQHLRCLLKEKEEIIESLHKDKQNVEKDIEAMWQAATSENRRVKNILLSSSRKLKDHVSVTDALKEEMENEELLHFSE